MPRFTAKMMMNIIPSQKCGIEIPPSANPVLT